MDASCGERMQDCVLLWDGSNFILEKLVTCVTGLRHVRDNDTEMPKASAPGKRARAETDPGPSKKAAPPISVKQLKEELTKRGLPTDGLKPALVERLEQAIHQSEDKDKVPESAAVPPAASDSSSSSSGSSSSSTSSSDEEVLLPPAQLAGGAPSQNSPQADGLEHLVVHIEPVNLPG